MSSIRKSRLFRCALMTFVISIPLCVKAQVGEHRDDLSIGGGVGYVLNSVGFSPRVSQGQHGGLMGGVAVRYVCEKYFNSICSIMGEFNYACLGWKEDILDPHDQQVINTVTGKEFVAYGPA